MLPPVSCCVTWSKALSWSLGLSLWTVGLSILPCLPGPMTMPGAQKCSVNQAEPENCEGLSLNHHCILHSVIQLTALLASGLGAGEAQVNKTAAANSQAPSGKLPCSLSPQALEGPPIPGLRALFLPLLPIPLWTVARLRQLLSLLAEQVHPGLAARPPWTGLIPKPAVRMLCPSLNS